MDLEEAYERLGLSQTATPEQVLEARERLLATVRASKGSDPQPAVVEGITKASEVALRSISGDQSGDCRQQVFSSPPGQNVSPRWRWAATILGAVVLGLIAPAISKVVPGLGPPKPYPVTGTLVATLNFGSAVALLDPAGPGGGTTITLQSAKHGARPPSNSDGFRWSAEQKRFVAVQVDYETQHSVLAGFGIDGDSGRTVELPPGTSAYVPDPVGRYVVLERATAHRQYIQIWKDGKAYKRLEGTRPRSWTPDGMSFLYACELAKYACLYDVVTQQRKVLKGCKPMLDSALSRNGSVALIVGRDVDDVQLAVPGGPGKKCRYLTHDRRDKSNLTWDPQGHILAFTAGGDLILHDADSGRERALAEVGSVTSLQWSSSDVEGAVVP